MSMKKLRNNPGYNGFDLSRKNLFTAKVGELLPVCTIECLPDDKFNLKHQHFTRTRPVNTAAYTRIREYYDWFFVPTNLLWNKFNTFVTQMGNNAQHAGGILDTVSVGSRHPYFTNTQVVNYLKLMQGKFSTNNNAFGFNRGDNTAKLLDYLGYGTFYNVVTDGRMKYISNANLNPFPLLAYQKIYSDYYRNSQWENAYAPSFNIDYANSGTQLPISDLTTATGVDNMFDLRYCNWNKDYFMGLLPKSQYGSAASISLSGSGNVGIGDTEETTLFAIYSQAATAGLSVVTDQAASTSSYPSEANSRLAVLDTNSGTTPYFALNSAGVKAIRDAMNLSGSGSISSAFTILALRQAQAKQRWAEITQSVGQDYKSQVEAHWGKEVSDAYSEKCLWLGGQSSNLDIQGVDNTNLIGSNQATIAGKGVGTGQSFEKFTAPCHGILMCIYHAVPVLDYMVSGVDKFNLKTLATDYAIPEMDKTGMVSVPIVELINGVDTTENGETIPSSFYNTLLGYAPLYYEYKTAYDTARGGFRFTDEYKSWVAPVTNQYLTSYMIANLSGNTAKVNYLFFKVNPAILNNIFDVNAGSGVTNDQLFVNLAFDIKASRKLDYNGLPM